MNKTNLPLYVNAKELPYGKKDDSASYDSTRSDYVP